MSCNQSPLAPPCDESSHRSYLNRVIVHIGLWPSAGLSVLVAPVAAVGVDGVLAENFASDFVEHGDGVSVDEDGHGLTFVVGADAEVVHATARRRLILPRRSTWSLRTR